MSWLDELALSGPVCAPWYRSYPPGIPCEHVTCWEAATWAGRSWGIRVGWWYDLSLDLA